MRPVVTVAEMQAADAAAPVPVGVLVERAGRAVAAGALGLLGGAYGRRVVVVAGKGNNGADGRAAARFLAGRGARVAVLDAAAVGAIEVPAGLNGATGAAAEGSVRADLTVTMAAWKPGLLLGEGPDRVGRVTVADIGLPVGNPAAHLIGDEDLA